MPSSSARDPGERRRVSMSDDRPASMKGPLPTGACPNVPAEAAAAGTIDNVGDANADSNDDHGADREMWTVPADGTDTAETRDSRSAPAAAGSPWATRSRENFTSSADTGVPLE